MGLYPDGPSRRMAWDADGTVMVKVANPNTGGGPSPGSHGLFPFVDASVNKVAINDENPGSFLSTGAGSSTTDDHIIAALLFPEPRELDGMYWLTQSSSNRWMYHSLNTTNGIDGTWTDTVVTTDVTTSPLARYRTQITSLAVPSVKSVKCSFTHTDTTIKTRLYSWHVYGSISPGQTPDRILFLDTANVDAVFTKPINWNEIPRGQTQTRSFKIKNNSAGLTINTIQVTAEDLYLNAGDWYTFGDDDVNFQATFAVGNLGPGATKLLYLKQIVPDAETLGVQAGRIKVSHASVT